MTVNQPEMEIPFAEKWNAFWFTPQAPATVGLVRMATGLLALSYLLSWNGSLAAWFGSEGVLASETVAQLLPKPWWRFSYLDLCAGPTSRWTAHGVGILIATMMAFGFRSRITTPLTLLVVLAYIHRAPMVVGLAEPFLTMLLAYLSLAPSGAAFSFDAYLASRRGKAGATEPAWTTSLATRLIQVHFCGLMIMTALNQLAGETWWSGSAVWWLLTRTETRLIDLTGLHDVPAFYLVNLWTHGIVALELVGALLIWNRRFRFWAAIGLLAAVAGLVPLTGLLPFVSAVAICLLAFVPAMRSAELWHRFVPPASP